MMTREHTSLPRASWSTRRVGVTASGAPCASMCSTRRARTATAGMLFNAVAETNTVAVALWRSLGFEILATIPGGSHHSATGAGVHVMYRPLAEATLASAPGAAMTAAYQWGQLDTALQQVTEGITLCRQFVYTLPLAAGLATLARIPQARGDRAGALDAIGRGRAGHAQAGSGASKAQTPYH
jgi:hypothetical protein